MGRDRAARGAAPATAIPPAIALAILFGILFQIVEQNPVKTTEYFIGYLVEKSLSVDNIFVFTLIFAALKTPKKLQQLALMWGILLALVLRGIMILIGAAPLLGGDGGDGKETDSDDGDDTARDTDHATLLRSSAFDVPEP